MSCTNSLQPDHHPPHGSQQYGSALIGIAIYEKDPPMPLAYFTIDDYEPEVKYSVSSIKSENNYLQLYSYMQLQLRLSNHCILILVIHLHIWDSQSYNFGLNVNFVYHCFGNDLYWQVNNILFLMPNFLLTCSLMVCIILHSVACTVMTCISHKHRLWSTYRYLLGHSCMCILHGEAFIRICARVLTFEYR